VGGTGHVSAEQGREGGGTHSCARPAKKLAAGIELMVFEGRIHHPKSIGSGLLRQHPHLRGIVKGWRIAAGVFRWRWKGRRVNSKRLNRLLFAIAAVGLVVAWWKYPAENEFSVMRCTISFLGSPDADRNPEGWRWYQVGMSALIVLMVRLILHRQRNFQSRCGRGLRVATRIYLAAFALLFVGIWIADTDEKWGNFSVGAIHTRVAIIGIFTMMAAVIADAVTVSRAGYGGRVLWPFRIYALIWIAGMIALGSWEWKCKNDSSLKHWPGDGIHSTPLWEWILFAYLLGFVIWISRPGTAGLDRE